MKKSIRYAFIAFLCSFSLLTSCTKEKEMLTESVSIKSVAVPTSLSTVTVEGTSQITITMSRTFRTQTTPLMLSPTFDLLSGYTISPASGVAVSFGTPSLAAGTAGAIAPVTYTLTSPSGVKRLYSVRVLFSTTQ
ncbi:hypothetical protein [Pedobacter ureilyticus]|uniref:DUF5018 domain-containing protein n=1 Tax=Pedobacter ureilyticus TaxID=1393051 RepID=A0ABW9J3B5_9SPHI|nr:hypothetical protein [Pedobacter helvus]